MGLPVIKLDRVTCDNSGAWIKVNIYHLLICIGFSLPRRCRLATRSRAEGTPFEDSLKKNGALQTTVSKGRRPLITLEKATKMLFPGINYFSSSTVWF